METFLAVCKHLSYTKAAEALRITQPAVSQHIRHLEAHYGVRLFHYEGKQLRLTNSGRLLLSAANTIKHDEAALGEQMRKGPQERMIFGATRTIGDFVLPNMLARYVRSHPDAEVRMIVDNTENLLRQLDSGALDFAVIEGYFQKADYDYQSWSSQRFIAVSAASHIFQKPPQVISDLFEERILLREPGSGSREIFERHIEESNASVQDFRQIVEIGSIHAIKALVTAGCGITFLYEAAAATELASGILKAINLSDFNVTHSFSAVWRKKSLYADQHLQKFSELLRQ
jgi:DNA-binding transcriptional LysR family regulator